MGLDLVETRAQALDLLVERRQWMPSLRTLHSAVGVSERRVETAFQDVYGVAPTTFMRQRALSAARLQLLAGDPNRDTVSAIANDHGFHHFGRFAVYYQAT